MISRRATTSTYRAETAKTEHKLLQGILLSSSPSPRRTVQSAGGNFMSLFLFLRGFSAPDADSQTKQSRQDQPGPQERRRAVAGWRQGTGRGRWRGCWRGCRLHDFRYNDFFTGAELFNQLVKIQRNPHVISRTAAARISSRQRFRVCFINAHLGIVFPEFAGMHLTARAGCFAVRGIW